MEHIGKWQFYDFKQVGSTNDETKQLVSSLHGEKIVVTAQTQTQGRGRRGRNWISPLGNLFFSLGLEFELNKLSDLVLISSLSLRNTIQFFVPQEDVKLKWPNDILLNDCKVSGMLIERADDTYWIVGMGVNLKEAPNVSRLIYPATCLAKYHADVSRISFIKVFLKNFEQILNQWHAHGIEPIISAWLAHAKSLNETISVHLENKEIVGIFRGVDNHGSLLLETAGEICNIYAGDVFYPIKEDRNNK